MLIRAVEPVLGIDAMLERTGKKRFDNTLTKGPGNLGKALGISKIHSGLSLSGNNIFICEDPEANSFMTENRIGSSKRIGVESAGIAALLPYRFYVKGNPFVSGYPNR